MSGKFNRLNSSTSPTYSARPTRFMSWRSRISILLSLLFITVAMGGSAAAQTITFESPTYTLGSINGQDGWSRTGSFDHNVSSTSFPGFGAQSLRISNAITSGSFGDQTFSKSLVNEAGETTADNNGLSGGVRQTYFESQFSIGSTVTGAQQPGLLMSTSPDRGDGARMSYLRFEDFADGIHVFFDDYHDNAPFGTAIGDTVGCGVEDNFTDTDIATLSRTVGHTIKFAMFFLDGTRNDVVQIYIDGVLVKTGTSWEDYSRYCANSQPATVDSLLFRTAGAAVPANSGKGFLIDNMNTASSTNATPTMVVDDDGQASLSDCNAADPAFTTINAAVLAADPGDTIRVCSGTYPLSSTVNLNKANLTLLGIGAKPVIQASSAIGNAFLVTASGVTLDNLEIQKTNLANQDLIAVQGNNFSAKNNLIYGPDPGTTWNAAGFVSRAFVVSVSNNLLFQNNVIHHLRQPAYFSGSDTSGGSITGNQVSGTKGWVVEGGNYTFSGNTFGEPQNQSGDIALLATLSPANIAFYQPLLALSTNNDNARIDGQYAGGEVGRAISYVSAGASPGGNGSDNANYQTITEGITGALKGGTVSVASGTYTENVDINKNVNVKGSFTVNGTLTTSVAGATLSPGNSPGIINSGNLSLTGGSNVNIELNGTTVGTQYDQLNVTGTVSLGGANLNVTTGFTPTPGNTFIIVNNDGGDAVTGTFNSLPQGATLFAGGNAFSISYVGGTGNDVVLTSIALCNTVSIGSNSTLTGQSVSVPINVDDTTNHGLISTDFTVTYNPAVVTFNSVTLGTVTAGSTITVNTPTANTIVVSIFRATPFSGAGTLANLNFTAIGAPGTSSPVNYSAFKFNEGTPCLTTTNGTISILSGTITGEVTYGNALVGGGPSPRHVPNTILSAVGSVNVSTSTANNGTYTLSGMGAGAYTVTPSKTGEDFGALTGSDSSLIAQHVVGITTLSATQQTVADVSGAGGVTSFDAALIARYVVALPGSGTSGNWIFVPTSRSYPDVNTNQSGQNYSALLMGDVTGNWLNPVGARPAQTRTSNKSIPVTIGDVSGSPKSALTIPITVPDLTGKGIVAYQFDLKYDHTVIEPQSVPVELVGTISDKMVVTANAETPGILKVVVFGALPLESKGLLLNLKFTALGEAGSSTPLTLETFMVNEGDQRVKTFNGMVKITDQPEEEASIEGSLFTAEGKGVSSAWVTLTNSNTGETYTVLSNPFGVYRFGGIKTGRTYVISVESKDFTFAPQAISLLSDMTGVDLRAGQ